MSIFEKQKIKLLNKKINLIIEKAKQDGRFSLFMASFLQEKFTKCKNYSGLKNYFNLIQEWDSIYKIPYEIGMQIDNLTNDNVIMIHRTRLFTIEDPLSNGDLCNIMNEGLINYGHANSSGAIFINDIPSLTLTSTPLVGLTGYINLLGNYKENNCVILMAFSKKDLLDDGEVIDSSVYNKIYYKKDGEDFYRVRPEYMLGVYLKNDSNNFEFFSKKQFSNNDDIKKI